jgi:hypothetical protein
MTDLKNQKGIPYWTSFHLNTDIINILDRIETLKNIICRMDDIDYNKDQDLKYNKFLIEESKLYLMYIKNLAMDLEKRINQII